MEGLKDQKSLIQEGRENHTWPNNRYGIYLPVKRIYTILIRRIQYSIIKGHIMIHLLKLSSLFLNCSFTDTFSPTLTQRFPVLDYHIDSSFGSKYPTLNFHHFSINNKCNIGSEITFHRGFLSSLNFTAITKLQE